MPERRIGPQCELFAAFAQGGMATVHLGRWTGAGGFTKIVAVKSLHPQLATDQRLRDMLRDEARMVSRIRHPGVMPTIDVVEDDGEVFMIMDYVHGATLSQLLRATSRSSSRVAVDVALRVISDTLHGLHAAHEACDADGAPLHIIHRDVSPQNILIGVDGYAQLIDFGVAHAMGRVTSTRTGEIKGKLSYLAPEQLIDDSISRRTDVYGASVVLWQTLTGRKLFEGKSFSLLVSAILEDHVAPPSELVEGISPELDAIVMKGLSRHPDDRFATAQDMADAIDALNAQAPRRRVGRWVAETASARLEGLAALVSAVENAPLSSETPPAPRRRQVSLIDPEEIELSKTAQPQPSRTQLTSLAEATPRPPPAGGSAQWLLVLGVAALAGAIWFSALQRRAELDTVDHENAAAPSIETAEELSSPREPVPTSEPTLPKAPPSATASAAPAVSASVPKKRPAPPRVRHKPVRKPRERWLPDDI